MNITEVIQSLERTVRVRAAVAMLETGLKIVEANELLARIEQLEAVQS